MRIEAEEQIERAFDSRLLRWVWGYIRPYRRLFWLSVALMPLNTIFALLQPYVIKLTIDIFLAARRSGPPHWLASAIKLSHGHGLIVMGALYMILLLGEFATFYGQFYLTNMVSQYSLSDLRLALFRHVERLPMSFFDRTPVGRLVSRMTTDIDAINEMFGAGSLTLFVDVLTLGGIVGIMFWFSPHLALWSLCAIPPLLLILNYFRVRSRAVFRDIRERFAALNSYLSESLSGMAIIQLFTRERESFREFDELNRKSRDSQRLANIYDAGQFSSVEALSSFTVAIILWIGGGEFNYHLVCLGTLVALIQYAQM